ncbi:amidohydrolase [Pseudalkalibacillus caeni]|uniref:Amidohydrolase n=1 Tax=Exobacillus caeni TaxID=2574798 RepID=A0A5R9F5S4_9BACL|nr:amidohydrolase [Pseudalkalibacillus caeni]TLS39102.1 amidohydrolase [Pseudalkalibacillus caeni]
MATLWHGGTIYTMAKENETVNSVLVEQGKIIKTGKKEELEKLFADKIEHVIDLGNKVMYPGFVDSHLHVIGHGEKLLRLNLSEVSTAERMKELLKEKIADLQPGDWIIGEGWNENNFPDRKIFHLDELDEIAPENPMMLTRVCRHAILANSFALELAGITEETSDPSGGVILRDYNGKATGYLLDTAQDIVKQAIPEVSESYIKHALQTSVDDLLKMGLVGGHTEDLNYYGGFKRTYDAFTDVLNGSKKFRAHLLVHHEVVDDMVAESLGYGSGTETVELGAMKIFADGALGGRTALLSKPYNDSPETSGVAIHSLDELKGLVKKARKNGMPVAIHTIGDLAMEYALDAIEAYPITEDKRDRVIHGQILREDLIERLSKLPVVVDIQPRFVPSDFPWVVERLGTWRMDYSYAWKTMIQNNVHCAGGSDAPIEPADPLLGIHAAITRKSPGETHEGYYPEEKLTAYEAIELFTKGSAFAICKEHERGIIKEGFDADFTVLDQDLFKIEPDEILDTNVEMTIVDGTIQYKRN